MVLRVEVDARGRPGRVTVATSSGSGDLDAAAVRAARRARFEPARRGRKRVPGFLNMAVQFRLDD